MAWLRVRRMQTKLHQWAADDPGRRFDDLYNLICHPDFLALAWDRVVGNKGARTPGVDRVIPAFISDPADVAAFLNDTREQLKTRTFTPLPARERLIPKAGQSGKFRRLGIRRRGTGWCKRPWCWCWSRFSRRTSSRAPTASVRNAELRTRSLRFTTSVRVPGTTSGCSRPTSRRASTSCPTRPSWRECGGGSGTNVSWLWSSPSSRRASCLRLGRSGEQHQVRLKVASLRPQHNGQLAR